MRNKVNKVLVITMLIIMLLPMQIIQVFATTDIGSAPYLERGELGDYTVQFWNGSNWVYISYNIVTYDDGTDTRKVAYCITPNTPGIEHTNDGSVDGYSVNITQLLSDPTLWRVLRYGYPYVTPESLGVETEQDAYLATKLAIQCILVNRNTEDIKTYYRAGQSPVAGLKLADIQRRGQKVINAIYNLVYNARNSNETPSNNTIITATKVGELKEESNYYYSQTYSVNSTTEMSYYTVRDIIGFPTGSFASDLNGNAKSTFNNGENFKIMIPKSSITGDISGEIIIDSHCKTYSIFYGEGPVGFQDYAVYTDPYRDLRKTIPTNIEVANSKITIIKTDKDTGERISGVTFNAKYNDGTNIGNFTTNSNGVIEITDLKQGTIVLTETKTKENYKLNTEKINVNVGFDENKTVNVTNEKKKAQIKIIKVDKDNKEVKLEGVKFEVIDSKNNVVETLTTNKNGEAITKQLPIDEQYKVKETITQETYILSDEVKTVTLQENQIKTITFENEKKKGNLEVLKVDKDNNKIGIGNVEFDLYSEELQKVIGTYKTNVNGEIKVNNLRVGSYKLIEKLTNKWYNLAEDKTVEIKWNTTQKETVENELKKGQIKIIKVDKDNNEVKLAGVKFNVIDEKGNVLETITTDESGEATTSKYPIRDYEKLTLKETETLEEYVLSEETQTVVLEENEIKTITFENEVKKAQIKVIKVDKDNQEVKLKGVKFNVLDEDGNIVETLITDENGEATTKRLPITEEYTVVETETLQEYKLTEEKQTVTLKQDEIKTLTFENEKRKGQLKIIKVDMDNNEVLLKDVKFEIKDESGNIVETLVTDENGEATTKPLAIDQKYTIVETETQKEYVLTEETKTIELTEDEITTITFENEKIKGQIQINKISADDNKLTGEKAGTKLEGAKFEIYDARGNLVDTLITDKDGKAISKLLVIGEYTITETESGSKFYLVNTEVFKATIKENLQIVNIDVKEESVDIDVGVKKTGFKETQSKDTIYYDFSDIINKSNVSLENFTWKDTLPTNALTANRIYTGTWNEELNYSVWYKTNLNDEYVMLVDGLNSTVNNEVKFTNIDFKDGEFVTDFEFRFGTVKSGFREVEQPRLYCDMKDNLGNGFIFTNHTMVSGNYEDKYVEDKDDWTTITYYKDIKINEKLPKTGF